MKFATHTRMMVATWKDVELAATQGTLTAVIMSKKTVGGNSSIGDYFKISRIDRQYYGESFMDDIWFIVGFVTMIASAAFFAYAVFRFVSFREEFSDDDTIEEPLVAKGTMA